MKKPRNHVDDLRGASRLAVEATKGVTDLVEAMHHRIALGPANPITGLVYGGIRGVTRLVGASIDKALAQLAPLLGASLPGFEREAIQAVLNGVLGDYLQATGNPLAIEMGFHDRGARAGKKLVVLVHGSSMSDVQWLRTGHDHGAALARDLGYTPIYLHYNSGLHISTNGRAFSDLLDTLIADEIVILGHSMGGLVARSACHYGKQQWLSKLSKLVCLGSPHHGAPLERGGNWVDLLLGLSTYSAPLARLGQIRSAGVTDMRYGSVRDEDWKDLDRFAHGPDNRLPTPLPAGVACYAAAAVRGPNDRSDGLVPLDSALGRHTRPEMTLAFAERWTGEGMNHFDLLGRPEVYDVLKSWLSS